MPRGDGWTLERRGWQSRMMLVWRPWEKCTGPRTPAGKARSSQNGTKHGMRGELGRRFRAALKDLRAAERAARNRF